MYTDNIRPGVLNSSSSFPVNQPDGGPGSLFPEKYHINIFFSKGSQAVYEDIVRGKLTAMRVSTVLLNLGVQGSQW